MNIKFIMRFLIVSLTGLASSAAFENNKLLGRYENASYNGTYQKAFVEISENGNGTTELSFNIPCNTKLIPRKFSVELTSEISGTLQLLSEGSSQCFSGKAPHIILFEDKLVIYTSPRIRVPGFDGVYELTKVK